MIETFRGQAHPWLCDVMGHLNTRHFMSMFDDASMHFLSVLLGDSPTITCGNQGWADVKVTLELKSEVPVGYLVRINTEVVRVGTKSLTYRSVMSDPKITKTHAIAETVTVLFDLSKRTAIPLSEEMRDVALRYISE